MADCPPLLGGTISARCRRVSSGRGRDPWDGVQGPLGGGQGSLEGRQGHLDTGTPGQGQGHLGEKGPLRGHVWEQGHPDPFPRRGLIWVCADLGVLVSVTVLAMAGSITSPALTDTFLRKVPTLGPHLPVHGTHQPAPVLTS